MSLSSIWLNHRDKRVLPLMSINILKIAEKLFPEKSPRGIGGVRQASAPMLEV